LLCAITAIVDSANYGGFDFQVGASVGGHCVTPFKLKHQNKPEPN